MSEERMLDVYIMMMREKCMDVSELLKKMEILSYNLNSSIKEIDKLISKVYSSMSPKNFKSFSMSVAKQYLINKPDGACVIAPKVVNNKIKIDNPEMIIKDLNLFKESMKKSLNSLPSIIQVKNQLSMINSIIKKYDSKTLFSDRKAVLSFSSFISSDTIDIDEDIKKILEDYLLDKYTEFVIEEAKKLDKKMEERRKQQEKNKEVKQVETPKIIEEISSEKKMDFLSIEEKEFITIVSNTVFSKENSISYINDYHINLVKHTYEELIEMNIDISLSDYNKFKNDVILSKMKEILYSLKVLKDDISKYESDSDIETLNNIKTELISELDDLYIQYENGDIKNVDELNNEPKKNLFYITLDKTFNFDVNNIRLFNELKNVPQEYYASYLNLLEKLESGYVPKSSVKGGKYATNSKKSMLYHLKNFKTRLVYMPINDNNVLVIMLLYKKSTNDKYDSDIIDIVYSSSKEYIESLKNALSDNELSKNLIIDNKKITDEFKSYLIENARGKKLKK